MADIEVIANEDNFNIDFTLFDENGEVDLTDFGTNVIDVRPTDLTGALIVTADTLTKPGATGVLRWNIQSTTLATGTEGTLYYAQITIQDTVNTITRKSRLMTLKLEHDIS